MARRLLTAAVAITLLGAAPAGADIASEVVHSDREREAVQIVAPPRPERLFAVPNVSEFSPDAAADLREVRIVPYPRPVYPFGVPNVSEFEVWP